MGHDAGRRILIVDDDEELVQILTLALRACGYEVSSAGDPASGLQAARSFKPDIILLDYHMPGNTGAHLYEAFRRNRSTSETPILFMSGEATSEHILGEIDEPARTRFLSKPVRIAHLQSVIEGMLAS
jgi:DNA-binding response OmpR family regulator